MKTSRHCLGSYSPRQLARDLVAMLEHDMQYIAWFVAVARAYPDDAATMDWPAVMQVARSARLPLQVASALLSPQAREGTQNLRRVPVARRSNFSRGPTGPRRGRPKADSRS